MTDAFVKMHVFGWLADSQGCGYYRVKLPMDELTRQCGARIRYGEQMWDGDRAEGTVIVGQRVCQVGPSVTWQQLRGTRPLVFEIDDDLLDVDPSSQMVHRFFNQPGIRDRFIQNMQAADLVTVSTAPLAERMSQYNPRVAVLPNFVDQRVMDLGPRVPDDRLTIGWGGSATHLRDFMIVAPHLNRVLERFPAVGMKFVGQSYAELLQNRPCEISPWTSVYADPLGYYRSIDFDIGLAPLSPHRFNASKSHIKALEYAVCGIPVVASDEPPYRDFVQHGQTGFLVKRDHEWVKYLTELVRNDDLRASMGAAARAFAQGYAIQDHAYLWSDAYRSVM